MSSPTSDPSTVIREAAVNPFTPNPYLMVVGCPRSGTTLLQRMLDHHPLLAVANDTHFIPRALEEVIPEALQDVTDGRVPPLTVELVEWILKYHRFPRLGLSEDKVRQAAANVPTYSRFVSALYSEYGRLREKPLAGEKTPDYVRHLPLLRALFPWIKIIHIVRDGRDVALSILEWARPNKGPGRFALWLDQPVAVCALWWRWQVSAGRRDGSVMGPAWYQEVTYEDLVTRPDLNLRSIADFLGLPFAPEMLAYHEDKPRCDPPVLPKKVCLPPMPGLRNWRTQMTERDLELFEAISGDFLVTLGYQRAFDVVSPEIAAVAERCQRWWDSEMAKRQENFSERMRSQRSTA